MQSPIHIQDPIITKHYTPFNFNYYNQPCEAQLTYTEDAVNIKFSIKPNLPRISGAGLFKEYLLSDVNFRWDSEHIVKEQRYPLEAQLIHYAKVYENFKNALNYKDGIAILVTFYTISDRRNDLLESLLETIPSNQPTKLPEPLIPRQFLPPKIGKFYRYNGSLTTPCFDQTVIWTVFENPSHTTEAQLGNLKQNWLLFNKTRPENRREIQEAQDRRIYQSAF